MSAVKRNFVTIKGVKDGLVFLLNDQCEFDELVSELRHKLEHTHQQILTGPIIHVNVKLGSRQISTEEKELLMETIRCQGNLIVQSIDSDEAMDPSPEASSDLKLMKGMIRSGQTVFHRGNLLYIGDVNPGGTIISTGDIWIMGSLRGMAHAGSEGNTEAVIAASHLRPTQLRIGEVISRPPDEWGIEEAFMEFAYLEGNKMQINKLTHLHKIRPGAMEFKGV
ncbi:septum site-determining protein MinC [Marinicrinis lubricantis]|uniref:Probable septum site-determining protein MinC n=1 Tax=Marinicrinis lubricantis TaxID=2086470 RepID=A0ABW1IU20_9BACL